MLDFLGIGAQKAGTTWLYEMLGTHPNIAFPCGKEVHFWDRAYSANSKSEYFSRFEGDRRCCGEITPAYAMLSQEIIREIYASAPYLRLILIIRNPIDRAWSSALMALERATMRLEEASDQWFIDHFRSSGSLARGDYLTTMRNWWQVFGEDALLVKRYEAIKDDPRGLLEGIAAHLGVALGPFQALPDAVLNQRIFPSLDAALRPSLRPTLEALYRDQIQSLEDDLGEPLPW